MKALSVRQPYAELIARGVKTIEVRTWRTDYRGPLLIVSSAGAPAWDDSEHQIGMLDADCPRGVAVCVVDLADIHAVDAFKSYRQTSIQACCAPSQSDLAWCLTSPRRVEPVPIKGRLRLYDVDDTLVRLVQP